MTKTARDLMIPVKDYACVAEDASLSEVIRSLEEIQRKYAETYHYKHRAVLVCAQNGRILGKIGLVDVLRSLDPRYKELGEVGMLTRFGINLDFLQTMRSQFRLLNEPLDDLCKKAASIKAKEIMHKPVEGEFVAAEASLNEAIHKLIIGQHQSLLVTDRDAIVGVLRMVDVFREVAQMITQCETAP